MFSMFYTIIIVNATNKTDRFMLFIIVRGFFLLFIIILSSLIFRRFSHHSCIQMNTFIKQCKKSLKLPRIVVLGNESCDLDSAVCSITLAFHLHRSSGALLKSSIGADCVVPVLNVLREELPLKTEVVYYLRENHYVLSDLICKDEINLEEDGTSFMLVDHHVSKYRSNVVGVIDHRPFDASSLLNPDVFKYIIPVGSCATLITKLLHDSGTLQVKTDENVQLLRLLYGPIVLDTVNFSKEADKARELDHEMTKIIEQYLSIENSLDSRQILFNNLVAKRSDVSGLNSLQILSKDLKIISRNGRVIAIPGYPILVRDYLKLENAESSLRLFAQKTGSNVIVLMGMKVNSDDSRVNRDLGIININDSSLYKQILTAVLSSKEPNFGMNKHCDCNFLDGQFFEQRNIKASRKQLLPLINEVLNKNC